MMNLRCAAKSVGELRLQFKVILGFPPELRPLLHGAACVVVVGVCRTTRPVLHSLQTPYFALILLESGRNIDFLDFAAVPVGDGDRLRARINRRIALGRRVDVLEGRDALADQRHVPTLVAPRDVAPKKTAALHLARLGGILGICKRPHEPRVRALDVRRHRAFHSHDGLRIGFPDDAALVGLAFDRMQATQLRLEFGPAAGPEEPSVKGVDHAVGDLLRFVRGQLILAL